MNRKILGILVVTLLISSLLPIAYSQYVEENTNISNAMLNFRYDFIKHAHEAHWTTGNANEGHDIDFGGLINDELGFACYRENIKLEDGKYYSKVLETHPLWKPFSYISGGYPKITIPSDATLHIRVGYLDGAVGTDMVGFVVLWREENTVFEYIIYHWQEYDGILGEEKLSLNDLSGKTGYFQLTAYTAETSNRDWAAWLGACIYSYSDNPPPETPNKPQGPTSGKKGGTNSYKTSTEDYTLDKVNYGWDWNGDQMIDEWSEYYNSGQIIESTHIWNEEGTYQVSVKAKDEFGAESGWSEPLVVTIPKNKSYINTPFLRFLENHPHMFPLLRQLLDL